MKDDKKEGVEKEFLQALKSNSMTTKEPVFSYLWRPNNYRRQVKFGIVDFEKRVSTIKGLFPMEKINVNSHTKLISVKVDLNITLQIGRETVVGIWSQDRVGGSKLTYLIEGDRLDYVEGFINEKKVKIRDMIDSDIKRVYNALGGRGGIISWSRHEDWIKGGEFINNLPRECIVHDTVFKKVYGEGIEFTGGKDVEPNVRLKNYVKNHALKDIAPEIANKLNLINPLGALKQDVKCVDDLFALADLVRLLDSSQRLEFETWLFEQFGING